VRERERKRYNNGSDIKWLLRQEKKERVLLILSAKGHLDKIGKKHITVTSLESKYEQQNLDYYTDKIELFWFLKTWKKLSSFIIITFGGEELIDFMQVVHRNG